MMTILILELLGGVLITQNNNRKKRNEFQIFKLKHQSETEKMMSLNLRTKKDTKDCKVSKHKNDLPQLAIYSDHPENLSIIDQEYNKVVIISTKGRIRTFPLPQ